MSFPYYTYVARNALQQGFESGIKAVGRQAVIGGAKFGGKAVLFVGKKIGQKMGDIWTGATHTGRPARFIGPWNRLRAPTTAKNSRVALIRGPDGRPYYVQRASGGARTRIPLRFLRSTPVLRRAVPNFGFGGVAGSELDVANFSYPIRRRSVRRPRRRLPVRRRSTRVKRVTFKKRRIYRR